MKTAFFLFLLSTVAAFGHPLDVIYFDIKKSATENQHEVFNSCFNMHIDTFQFFQNQAGNSVESETLMFRLLANEKICQNEIVEKSIKEKDFKICIKSVCQEAVEKEQVYSLHLDILNFYGSSYSVIGQSTIDDNLTLFTSEKNNSVYRFKGGTSSVSSRFFHLGIEHIGALPSAWRDHSGSFHLAAGIDHILFLLVLTLGCTSWLALIKNISAFTIGHAISITLSLLSAVVIPAIYIEPAIALSIAIMAVLSLSKKQRSESFFLSILFGLLHGLAFSFVLHDLRVTSTKQFITSLIMFNLGIESGQMIIILFLAPVFIMVRNHSKGLRLKQTIALIVFVLGLYWTYQRILTL